MERTDRHQKKTQSLRVKSLDARAARLLPEDQRRIAYEKASTDSAKQAKGMFKQDICKSLGHVAHRGWARLRLDRRRDLIIHGPASHRTDSAAGGEVDERELEHDNYYHNPDRGVQHGRVSAHRPAGMHL